MEKSFKWYYKKLFLLLFSLVFFGTIMISIKVAAAGTAIPVAVELSSFDSSILNNNTSGSSLLLYKGTYSSYLSGGSMLVAPNVNSQAGTVVRRNRMKLIDGFSTYFQVNMSSSTSGTPADGLCFVIYSSDSSIPDIGVYGGGIGYAGIPNSIGVEFDIYTNSSGSASGTCSIAGVNQAVTVYYSDPSSYHVAIDTNGSVYHNSSTSTTSTDSSNPTNDSTSNIAHNYSGLYGQNINIWIDYYSGYVTVTYGTGTNRTDSGNYSFKRYVGTDLVGKDVFVGFSSSTGGCNANHLVNKWYFDNSYVEGGLSSAANSYTQAASTVSIGLNGTGTNNATSPTHANISLYNATGAVMANQDFNMFLDGSSVGTFNTGVSGTYDYTISGLSSGQHTLKAESTDGSAVNVVTFTEPSTVTYQAGSNGSLSGSSTESVDYNGKPSSPPTPIPDIGYSFSYWSSNGGMTQLSTAQLKLQTITANITYTAYFTQTPYTITYNGNASDGAVPTDGNTYHYGDTVTVKSAGAMTKTGYTFNGWKDQDGNSYTATGLEMLSMPAKNVTFTAQWTANPYTITYDGSSSDGGVPTDSNIYHYGDTVTVKNAGAMTKTGYTFNGWKDQDGNNYTATGTETLSMPAKNVTFTAQWTANPYTITYDGSSSDGGVPTDSNIYHYGDTVTVKSAGAMTKTGYTFNGWKDQDGNSYTATGTETFSMPAKDVAFTAQWTANPYTITYNGNASDGGVPTDGNTYHYGDTVTVKSAGAMTKTGYTFNGWKDQDGNSYTATGTETFSMPAKDVALTAQWTANPYTITYNGNASDGGTPTDSNIYHYGDTVTVKSAGAMTKTGYTFNGWKDQDGNSYTATGTETLSMPAKDVALTAQWTANPYTITYNGNASDGGTPTDSNIYHYGDTVTVKSAGAMTKTGYTFNGWKDQDGNSYTASGTETFSMPAKNVTLTAQWTINSYSVTYDGNGNTSGAAPSDISSPHDYDTQITVLDNTNLAKTGYKFSGWNTAADGSGTSYIAGDTFNTPADNMVLYAKWTLITYKVTYDSNAADAAGFTEDSAHIYDTDKNLTLNGYTMTGYTFNGWNTEANGSGIAYTDGQSVVNLTIIDEDTITLYAQWTINSYAVTFDSNKGSSTPAQTVNYKGMVTKPSNPARIGYTFDGWYKEAAYIHVWNFAADTVTGDMTLYAKWHINSYTVRFDTNDGSAVSMQIVNYGGKISKPDDPTRTGYAFDGWYKDAAFTNAWNFDFDTVTGNKTLYAKWTPELTLDINTSGGTVSGGDTPSSGGTTSGGNTYVGGNIEITPSVQGGTWEFDSTYLSRNGNEFTGLKAGTTTLKYIVGSQTVSIVVTIASSEIPKGSEQTGHNSWLIYLLSIGLTVILLWIIFAIWHSVIPIVEAVTKNNDGTYTIQWGYKNRWFRKSKVDNSKSKISMLRGRLVSSSAVPPNDFRKGRVKNVFTSTIDKNGIIEWKIKRRRVRVDISEIDF